MKQRSLLLKQAARSVMREQERFLDGDGGGCDGDVKDG